MEDLAGQALNHAKTLLDQVPIYYIKIEASKAQNRRAEAVEIGLQILYELGIEFPEEPTGVDIQAGFAETAALLKDQQILALIDLPELVDPKQIAALKILASMNGAAFFVVPNLFPLLGLKQVNISLQHGNTTASAQAYACYAISLCGVIGEIDLGYQFGQLALQVLEKFDAEAAKPLTTFIFNVFVHHWKEHLRQTLPAFLEAYQCGLKVGDLDSAAFSAQLYGSHSLAIGKELGELEQEITAYGEAIICLKHSDATVWNQLFRQVVLNLRGFSENPCQIKGEAYDDEKMMRYYQQHNDKASLGILCVQELILNYLFRNYSSAIAYSEIAFDCLDTLLGKTEVALLYFYDSLLRLAMYPDAPSEEQEQTLARVAVNQAKLETWANHAPMNYLHKFQLVEAKRHRVLGHFLDAIEMFDSAIANAKANGYQHEEALGNELAARFYLDWHKDKIARSYLIDAYYGYMRWGAIAKAKQIESLYAEQIGGVLQYSAEPLTRYQSTASETAQRSSVNHSGLLDFLAVAKATQALSREIEADRLISTLMQVVIENAGAETCILLLPEGPDWNIASQIHGDAKPVQVPQSIVNFVARTSEAIVLNNARTDVAFAKDPEILDRQPQSILCLPVQHQGQLLGILYLENNLTPGAFSSDRLEILKILIAQAAICLQNSGLYQNLRTAKAQLEDYSRTLEKKVEQRTQELSEKNQHLSEALLALKNTQAQLVQTEKMSSLEQMVAGIAHEINNPINFIHGNIKHADHYCQDLLRLIETYQIYYPNPVQPVQSQMNDIDLEFLEEDVQKLFRSMQSGVERIRQIVLSLRTFSRLDEAEMKPVQIQQGIDSALLLLQHRLSDQPTRPEIQVNICYARLPEIFCYARQVNQAVLNLLNNAIDAIEDRLDQGSEAFTPTIAIQTEQTETNSVAIHISDNGLGIPETIQARIFDPFFTTKPVGRGTGLGLSVAYSIAAKHGGQIRVSSNPGEGCTMTFMIPIQFTPEE